MRSEKFRSSLLILPGIISTWLPRAAGESSAVSNTFTDQETVDHITTHSP